MQVEKFKKDKIAISFFKPEEYILIFLFIYLLKYIFSRVAQFSIAVFIIILSTKLRSGTIQAYWGDRIKTLIALSEPYQRCSRSSDRIKNIDRGLVVYHGLFPFSRPE